MDMTEARHLMTVRERPHYCYLTIRYGIIKQWDNAAYRSRHETPDRRKPEAVTTI